MAVTRLTLQLQTPITQITKHTRTHTPVLALQASSREEGGKAKMPAAHLLRPPARTEAEDQAIM